MSRSGKGLAKGTRRTSEPLVCIDRRVWGWNRPSWPVAYFFYLDRPSTDPHPLPSLAWAAFTIQALKERRT